MNGRKQVLEIAGAAIIAAFLLLAGHSWLQEHDARLLAEATVKQSEAQITVLQAQQKQVDAAAKVKVTALQNRAEEVKTAPEAIAALPEVTDAPLKPEPLPDAPDAVKVDAVPLYQALNTCDQDKTNLEACAAKLGDEQKITVQKDAEIEALKKHPGFWHRLGRGAKVTLCAGAGGGLGFVKGGEGAAIGAAAGALVCQLF